MFMTLRFPGQLVALVPALAALAIGVRLGWSLLRAKTRGLATASVIAGLILTAICVVNLAGRAMIWNITIAYQECMTGAITVSAPQRCATVRDQSLQDFMNQLSGGPATDHSRATDR
jgi:hypothetical protein